MTYVLWIIRNMAGIRWNTLVRIIVGITQVMLGLVMIFNGVMMLNQSWEAMKDLFCVEPVLVFFLIFSKYLICLKSIIL